MLKREQPHFSLALGSDVLTLPGNVPEAAASGRKTAKVEAEVGHNPARGANLKTESAGRNAGASRTQSGSGVCAHSAHGSRRA